MPSKRNKPSNKPLFDSDAELFPASETELEEYSGDDQEWEVEKVLGVEVDLQCKKRYEVQWKGWQRKDGTSTTWEYLEGEDSSEVRDSWDNRSMKNNRANARTKSCITLNTLLEYLPHNIRTAYLYEGYDQKLEKWRDTQSTGARNWDEEIETRRNRHIRREISRAPSEASSGSSIFKKRKRTSSISSVSTMAGPSRQIKYQSDSHQKDVASDMATSPKSVRARLRSQETIRTRDMTAIPFDYELADEGTRCSNAFLDKAPKAEISSSVILRDAQASSQPSKSRGLRTLQKNTSSSIPHSGHLWTKAVRVAGAAPIDIVNEVDNESLQVPLNFVYLENEVRYGKGVKRPSESEEFMCGCSCTNRCSSALSCDCQSAIGLLNENDDYLRAYDDKGLFLFNNNGAEVIECNQKCACSSTCKTRVAQKPRDVPLQIFKTQHNGWGVRSCQKIPKGKVLGIYTGEIITREEAEMINSGEHTFLFNLDTRDSEDSDLDFYTVDATNCGNWSRYINHSCSPNASVYSVVYDKPVEINMPYLAIVANQDVEAGVELTFDYNPGKSWDDLKKDKKGKKKRGLVKCLCGSTNCRGELF